MNEALTHYDLDSGRMKRREPVLHRLSLPEFQVPAGLRRSGTAIVTTLDTRDGVRLDLLDWTGQLQARRYLTCDEARQLAAYLVDCADAPGGVPVRCPLCSYQHGHAIGCANNPVDIALASGVAVPAAMHPDCSAPDCDCEPGIECAARGAARGVETDRGGEQR
jgi:hypothetical protein